MNPFNKVRNSGKVSSTAYVFSDVEGWGENDKFNLSKLSLGDL